MILFSVLLVLTAAASSSAALLGTRLEKALPPTLFAMTLFLYAFGLVNALAFGFWLLLAIIGVAAMWLAIRRRASWLSSLAEGVLSPGFVIFCLFAIAAFVFTRDMQLTHYDEFSHWGRVVKATFLHDALGPHNPVDLRFRSYPPGSSIFEYFAMKIGGRWHEGNLFWAYQLLCASLFVPFMSGLRWRQPGRIALLALLAALTPQLIWSPIAVTLVDPLLGFLFGYLLALVYTCDLDDWRSALFFALGLSMLVLLKDSGVMFLVVVLAAYVLRLVSGVRTAGGSWRRVLSLFLLPLGAVAAVKLSWSLLLRFREVETGFGRTMDPSEPLRLLAGDGPAYWSTVLRQYVSAIIEWPITEVRGVPMSQAAWFVVLGIALAFVAVQSARLRERSVDWSPLVVMAAGGVVYNLGLLVLYLFRFREDEAVRLAGYGRYLGSYWTGISVFLTLFVMWLLAEGVAKRAPRARNRRQRGAARTDRALALAAGWALVLIALLPVDTLAASVRRAEESPEARSEYHEIESEISEAGIGAGDRVMVVIRDEENGYDGYVLRYLLLESKVKVDYDVGRPMEVAAVQEDRRKVVESWAEKVDDFDYVVIFTADPSFGRVYGSLFEDPGAIADNTVFEVEDEGGTVSLGEAE